MNTQEKPGEKAHDQWLKDSSNWKLGIFYFNLKDKRVLVPKRWGFGWTFNFANPLSILFLIVLIFVPILAGILFSK